jgi:ABC-type sulfate transport system substrate-binding protein
MKTFMCIAIDDFGGWGTVPGRHLEARGAFDRIQALKE